MDVKSRYEVIAELEQKKRNLMDTRDSTDLQIHEKQKSIKQVKRQLEDMEEDLQVFINTNDARKESINAMIKSIEDTLANFNKSQS